MVKSHLSRLAASLALGSVLLVAYTNCSSYSENDLFSSPSSTVTGNINPGTAFLQAPISQVRGYNGGAFIVPGENILNLAGFCSPGKYTEHFIEFRLNRIVNGQTFEMSISKDLDCDSSLNPLPICRVITSVKCEQGRYSVAIPITTSTINALLRGENTLTLVGQMVVSENGVESRPAGLAMNPYSFRITKQ